jgi:SPP1 family predicted phage head-tail adaptor
MLAASLKYPITIEKKTITQDTLGSPKETWSTFKTVRAAIIYGTGARSYETEQETLLNSYTTTFMIRHLDNFGYNCRVVFDGEIFDIIAIEKLRRRDGFRIVTQRRVSNG